MGAIALLDFGRNMIPRIGDVSEVQFCNTERPQLFEFGVATIRTCRLRSKKAILEVATFNLQK